MPTIYITTEINAPIQRCFDLSRSIDLHMLSTAQTNEKAIAGITTGLIGLNEEVTWRARHFGVYQKLSVRITAMESPFYFEDKMLKGAFKKMEHKHFFQQEEEVTIMKDEFFFEAPFGIFGKIAYLFLVPYLRKFLKVRNKTIKDIAESQQWKQILS
jgi:ligand-binding SRPBCC domain-containing protein